MKDRILIVGAGVAGEELLTEVRKHTELNILPIGFIDDDKGKIGKKINDLVVLGGISTLKSNIKKNAVTKVYIALPSVEGDIIAKVLTICVEAGIPCQTIPRVQEIIEGTVDIQRIREVQMEDLLGRPVRKHDINDLSNLLRNSIIMVTGAAGSIGSELCRQIAAYKPKKIIMYDWWENGLYELGIEFHENFPNVSTTFIVGSVQDKRHIEQILKQHKPTIIFHAAAYKHVPLMEAHVIEAVKNNIFGTYNLVKAAKKAHVQTFVFVSTDKAVNPKSIMGMTKRIGEYITTSLQKQAKTRFICVRFGNVLNSAGSVLPLFRKQLPTGVITVTDEKMTRYFMTISEAVQLVLKATVLSRGNDIFVLDMGKPVKIVDMAKKFILLSGLIPEKNVTIKYIGLRPGEKLVEELTTKNESLTQTAYEKIFILKKTIVDQKKLLKLLIHLDQACRIYNEEKTKRLLKEFLEKNK